MRTSCHTSAAISANELGNDRDHDDDHCPSNRSGVTELAKINPQASGRKEDRSEEAKREPLDLLQRVLMLEA